MKRLSLLTACVLFCACGRGGLDFRDGLPSADAVKLEVPAKAGQTLGGAESQKQGLQGAQSDFYKLTRGVTGGVNLGVGFVLGLVKAITNHQPTTVNGNTAVWGPHTEDLSPNTWKLTVTQTTSNQFDYKLEGKAKTAPDTDYVIVLSGSHTPAVDAQGNAIEGFGGGTFTLDWDEAQKLPEHDANVGKAEVTYARADAQSNTNIEVVFTQVKDEETGALIDAQYLYSKKPAQGGEFEFSINKNTDAATSQIEHMTIKSRWEATGAGRADVRATGGDISGAATANECWDENFNSQYMATSWAPGVAEYNYGAEATDCAFTSADYSNL